MTSPQTQTGRRRSETSRHAVLEATFALMLELGLTALTIEGIAQRAGVGKMTIYRWWPGKGILIVDAFLTATSSALTFPEEGSARTAMTAQMAALANLYSGPTGLLARAIIGAGQSDPDMRHAFQQGFLFPRRQAAHQAFARGVASGEFRADVDPDVAIDALYGPIYYRILTSDASVDADFINATAALIFPGLLC